MLDLMAPTDPGFKAASFKKWDGRLSRRPKVQKAKRNKGAEMAAEREAISGEAHRAVNAARRAEDEARARAGLPPLTATEQRARRSQLLRESKAKIKARRKDGKSHMS